MQSTSFVYKAGKENKNMISRSVNKVISVMAAFVAVVLVCAGVLSSGILLSVLPAREVYAAQEPASPDNSSEKVEIKTYSDLAAAAANVDGSYILMADIDMSKAGEEGWKPWNFNGTFDGNGHTLYNMDIKTTTDITAKTYDGNLKEYDTYFAGFFGITDGAVISNLNIAGAYIELGQQADMSSKSIFAAILAGYMNNTTITGCSVEGYVSLTSTSKMWGTAGVAGFGNGLIENTASDVTLVCTDADPDDADKDEQFMGGIYADGYIDVKDCEVTIDGYISERGYVHSGGIAGLYILYPVSGSYVADIAGNTINGKITFYEDNEDRRAYCKALAGERMNLYTTSRDNTDNFMRNEVFDYTQTLKPENYVRNTYTVDNPYESTESSISAGTRSSDTESGELIEGVNDNIRMDESSGLKNRVFFAGLSDTARVIIIVVVIIVAVGLYYFITRHIRRRSDK